MKRKKRIGTLDDLAHYRGAAQEEWPRGGSSMSSWRVITTRIKPRKNVMSRHIRIRLFRTNNLKEGAVLHAPVRQQNTTRQACFHGDYFGNEARIE
jgi:hypothetical protein